MSAAALALVDAFGKKPYPGAFPCLDRSKIAFGLTERIADPSLINQGNVGLCTAAAVVFALARTRAVDYVRAVTELYDVGRTTIDKLNLKPCDDLRLYKLPASATIAQVDWIIMASIRDSANWFIDYQSVFDQGGGHGREIVDWLKKAGYTDVQGDWNELLNKTAANLKKADYLYSKDYQVLLRIDLDLLAGKTAIVSRGNHWVVLGSNVNTVFSRPTANVSMKVYTWGKLCDLPLSTMTLDDFVDYYYGFIAAKY